jgi:hypothetical protein
VWPRSDDKEVQSGVFLLVVASTTREYTFSCIGTLEIRVCIESVSVGV